MSKFLLRAATKEDAAPIRDLVNRVQINPTGLDWHRFVLAVDDSGRMLGCGQLKPHGTKIVELASIAVEPGHRRQGIARAIIEHLLSVSGRPLYLTCRAKLGPFYEQWGFHALGMDEMPPYYRRLARFVRTLTPFFRDGDGGLLVMELK